jgi:hypothetical protein
MRSYQQSNCCQEGTSCRTSGLREEKRNVRKRVRAWVESSARCKVLQIAGADLSAFVSMSYDKP